MAAHPDVAAEQAHLDWAHDCITAMRGRTEHALAEAESAATEVDSEIAGWHLRRRLGSLEDDGPALCFGRIDTEDADRWYVGRRHVEDDAGDPVVVDWRAPVSVPFYRATIQDPMGLERRRRFSLDGVTLVDIAEEDFTDPDLAALSGGIPDPLLAELDRERTGEMRDIVATIAAEQDEIIRAPLDRLLVVQGGPGTGKTAVALHRAAYLLYEHREHLDLGRVLVIGPNPTFLRYIAGVLPSLGETAVVQTTIPGLAGSRYRVGPAEDDAAATVLGDGRMAAVVSRAIAGRRRLPTEQVILSTSWGTVRISPDAIAEIMDEVVVRGVRHGIGREAFRNQVLHHAYERHAAGAEVPALKARFLADTRSDKPFLRLLDRWWPSLSPTQVVRSIVTSKAGLRRAAADLLDDDEQAAIVRPAAAKVSEERWTTAELALLDEAEDQLTGPRTTYGHVIVDEAQDLSTMALRMAARRAARGSLTVVGDLAQGTRPWSQSSWDHVVSVLGGDAPAQREELTIGYRVPAPILDLANRLLPVAAPGVTPARSVRPSRSVPHVVADEGRPLDALVAEEVAALVERFGSVALIADDSLIASLEHRLDAAGLDWAPAERTGRGEQVSVLTPLQAKGLEFDAVCVAEPAAMIDRGSVGTRALFVALTRAVQHLSLVHERTLPDALRSPVTDR